MFHFHYQPLLAAAATLLPATTLAHYNLIREYSGVNLVNNFDFYNGPDPTNGHVQYKGYASANATGLTGLLVGPNGTNVNNSTLPPPVYFGVDHTNVYPNATGRPSVRVSSVQTFNHSLILADIVHMPSSTCGVWPAFWMLGTAAPWPEAGEIDILENVNDNDFNTMTLHTNSGVIVGNDTSKFTGTMTTANCDVNAANQDKNQGCSVRDDPARNSYGTKFNSKGGGVFAIERTSEYIAIWFFSRDEIPANIASGDATIIPVSNNTDVASLGWRLPNALFQPTPTVPEGPAATGNVVVEVTKRAPTPSTLPTPSVLDTHFNSLQILFDTTFCGDWAGKAWTTLGSSCGKLAPTCEEYISANPQAFQDVFWAVQSIRVFQDSDESTAKAAPTGVAMKRDAGRLVPKSSGSRFRRGPKKLRILLEGENLSGG